MRGGAGLVHTVLQTSVASFYSNLVTRPTGKAVRVAIERQIEVASGSCLSILDFSQVDIIDYSCADEVLAKLLLRYRRPDRPSDAYFVARGVSDTHREPIDTVLRHHGLLMAALGSEGAELWGPAPVRVRRTWDALSSLGRAAPQELASRRGLGPTTAAAWLRRLASLRLALPDGDDAYISICTLADGAAR